MFFWDANPWIAVLAYFFLLIASLVAAEKASSYRLEDRIIAGILGVVIAAVALIGLYQGCNAPAPITHTCSVCEKACPSDANFCANCGEPQTN